MADEPFILGQQFAAARSAEAARIARADSGVSPLGAEDRYDQWRGDLDLYDPVRLPLDDRIRLLCREFASVGEKARSAIRRSLTLNDFYTLLTFAQRSAVFALRTRDPRWLVDGLTAIAIVEIARIDYRDAPGPAGLIYAIFHRIGVAAYPAFEQAAALAEPDIAELLQSFRDRPPNHRTLKACCFEAVDSPGGPGLIQRSGCLYKPTMRLDKLILQIAEVLRNDQYSPSVEIGTTLPDVWLSKIDDRALASALSSVVAGATAHGTLRPEVSPEHLNLGIIAFAVETANEAAAATLLRIARLKQTQNNDFKMLAAQDRRLFCLLIARNWMVGGEDFETAESIMRFQPGLEKLLQDCPAADATRLPSAKYARFRGLLGRLFGH